MVTAALLHVLTPDTPSQSCSEAQQGSQPGCTKHLPNCLNNFMSSIVVFVLKLKKKKKTHQVLFVRSLQESQYF